MTIAARLACWDYDRTRPLVDGRVKVDGVALDVSLMRPREAFRLMLEHEAYDIAEVSLANYAKLRANGDDRFVGIPVALSKMFRHSCIYVRSDSGIDTPADLRGRRIGVSQLDSTGMVFIKGMLQHDYGVAPAQMDWLVGGLEEPAPAPGWLPDGHGRIDCLGDRRSLVAELESGGIDALFSNHLPSIFKAGSSQVRRLFVDFREVEQDYFRRTGIFPVMHVIALRREFHRQYPDVARNLYAAFCRARDVAVNDLYDTDALRLSLPWLIDHIETTVSVLGPQIWRYGFEANRPAWEGICRYQVEQGITEVVLPPGDLFVPVE